MRNSLSALLITLSTATPVLAQLPPCRVAPSKVLVLSNFRAEHVAADFGSRMPNLDITAFNVWAETPTLAYLNQFDAVLLFEDSNFANAPNVGDAVYQYYIQGNKGVVLGVFFWQEAKDSPFFGTGGIATPPENYGWGALEGVVPLVNGDGEEYRPRTLNTASIITHPVTAGVLSLSVGGYAGGLRQAPGGTVLAFWNELNDDGSLDPAVGIREGSGSRIVGVSVFPNAPWYVGNDALAAFSGDFYPLWQNALTWAAFGSGCQSADTSVGSGIPVNPSVTLPNGSTTTISLTFDNVETAGDTTVNTSSQGPPPPSGFKLTNPPVYYEISTSATFSGSVRVCLGWAEGQIANESRVQMFHYEGNHWVDITDATSRDTVTNTVCGTTSSFSAFTLMEVKHAFTGFFQPVDNLPTVNAVKAGAAVPVKFSLGGDLGLDIFASGYPQTKLMQCETGEPIAAVEETVNAGSSSLSYDATTGLYTYVWKTQKAWGNSCRELQVKLSDGEAYTARFTLRK